MRVDSHIVQRVTNTAGRELYVRPPYNPTRVLDEEVARRMTSMMGAVVLRGPGTGARIGNRDVAGKTGTSSDWRDAWFVGYSRDFTAGVWVGHDDFTSMGRTTGGPLPAQIWADTMRVAHEGVENHPLPGIEQPAYIPAQVEIASFFDELANAFGDDSGGDDNNGFPDLGGVTTVKNSGAGSFILGLLNGDRFYQNAIFNNAGAGSIFPAYNTGDNIFDGDIEVQSTAGGGIRFCGSSSATAVLNSGKDFRGSGRIHSG